MIGRHHYFNALLNGLGKKRMMKGDYEEKKKAINFSVFHNKFGWIVQAIYVYFLIPKGFDVYT